MKRCSCLVLSAFIVQQWHLAGIHKDVYLYQLHDLTARSNIKKKWQNTQTNTLFKINTRAAVDLLCASDPFQHSAVLLLINDMIWYDMIWEKAAENKIRLVRFCSYFHVLFCFCFPEAITSLYLVWKALFLCLVMLECNQEMAPVINLFCRD